MKRFLFLILTSMLLTSLYATDTTTGTISDGNATVPKGPNRVNSAATNVTVTQFSDVILLDSESDATSTLTTTLYNQYGEEVYTSVTTAGTGIIDVIDTSDLESGVYTIVLEDNSGAYNQENIVL